MLKVSEALDLGLQLLDDGGFLIAITPNGSPQFREKNPWINPGVSLSKIRTLKAVAVDQWHELDLEMATLAFAFSYFEMKD